MFDESSITPAPGGTVGILRLAHVDVRTPDLELSTAYYTEVLGLQLAGRGTNGKEGEDAVYLKCWDEEDHHSVRLRYDPRTGLDLFTFRVEREDDLALRQVHGVAVEARRTGIERRPVREELRRARVSSLGERSDDQEPLHGETILGPQLSAGRAGA